MAVHPRKALFVDCCVPQPVRQGRAGRRLHSDGRHVDGRCRDVQRIVRDAIRLLAETLDPLAQLLGSAKTARVGGAGEGV